VDDEPPRCEADKAEDKSRTSAVVSHKTDLVPCALVAGNACFFSLDAWTEHGVVQHQPQQQPRNCHKEGYFEIAPKIAFHIMLWMSERKRKKEGPTEHSYFKKKTVALEKWVQPPTHANRKKGVVIFDVKDVV
jgi:hypothetical protein